MKKRTSRGYANSLISRLTRVSDHRALKAFRMSEEFADAFRGLDAIDRDMVLSALGRAHVRMDAKAGLAAPGSKRVAKWDAAMIAKLKAAEAKHGNDEGIARELGIPKDAARVARWKYIGRRAPPNMPQSMGAAATQEHRA